LAAWSKNGLGPTGVEDTRLAIFEEMMLPHLDAAHNLARWLTRNEDDAKDVVQEAYLRAFRFFDGYRGGDGKAWLLEIVRNTCRTWMSRQKQAAVAEPFDEASHGCVHATTAEEALVRSEKAAVLRRCIELLPAEFREVLVMRELEEMSYREIAGVAGVALGTIMSRLSRARKRLEECAAKWRVQSAR
jgi:RNA polymerase sigma-70 factor (ECF subfamily)